MGERSGDVAALVRRIGELERERDDLKKDVEQICLQQNGPSFLGVATRMHLQRTAGLEHEVENVERMLATCSREKQNIKEELSEVYRIKSQLAGLYNAEATKNVELEKQIKFFQGSIAAAFAERDHVLIECEKAKEQKEIIMHELAYSNNRVEELESACAGLWTDKSALGIELLNVKEAILPLEKAICRFYEIRQTAIGSSGCANLAEKCLCLLDDPAEMWVFDEDRNSSTSKYIASLENELDEIRSTMDNLQYKMQMGMDIELHLKRKVQSLEKKLAASDEIIGNGLSALCHFHSNQRLEVLTILEEESNWMKLALSNISSKIDQINTNSAINIKHIKMDQASDIECRDLHILSDTDYGAGVKTSSVSRANVAANENFDNSDILALALQEKVGALLLLSQQEERHLLERDLNAALQNKIEELQQNLFQATQEKVKALMELADLKRQFQLQQDFGVKHAKSVADSGTNIDASQSRDGKLKDFLRKTYLRHWRGTDPAEKESVHPKSSEPIPTHNKENTSTDLARLEVEIAALKESIENIEHLSSTIRKLRLSLLKVRNADAVSASSGENLDDILDNVIFEANDVKASLQSSLPMSCSVGESQDARNNDDVDKPGENIDITNNEKSDGIAAAGFEMLELLILAAELQKEKATRRSSTVVSG